MQFLYSSDPRVEVGEYSYGTPRFMLWDESERIRIGKFCSIAEDVAIFGGGEHRTDWITTYPLRIAFDDPLAGKDGMPHNKGPTVIGNDVWIGFRAIILSGVTIGHGAVVGAGAVVATNVPPYTIVAGNPAEIVRPRFSPETIEKLLSFAWWDWPLDVIRREIPRLSGLFNDRAWQLQTSEKLATEFK